MEIGKVTGRENIKGRGNRRGFYTVPFSLRFGHYDLAGIRLTALVFNAHKPLETLHFT